MATTQYQLACPHCGAKYYYEMALGDPATNTIVQQCSRCGQSERVMDYFRMNCVPSEQLQTVRTVLNGSGAINYVGNKENVNKTVAMTKERSGTSQGDRPGPVMTEINVETDPHIFRNPATLINPATGESLTMSIGEQTVGRASEEDGPQKGFHFVPYTVSRQHVCITTVECGDGRYVNMIMNCKNLNQTLLDGIELPTGAVWKLGKGMQLTMGELTVRIEDI